MSDRHLRVHGLPSNVEERELAGSTVVVIDLLRATSTICQALASGATDVVPFLEIEDVFEAVRAVDRDGVVLGGERRGKKIPGFDLGNSPAEYTRDVVLGKRVFITTTNGTRAMYRARSAERVILGSFLNLSAVVESARDEPRIDIVCAGTDGEETGEDILVAGAIVDALRRNNGAPSTDNIQTAAAMAGATWSRVQAKTQLEGRSLSDELSMAMRDTAGGRNCIEVGNGADLPYCAQVDLLRLVPRLNLREWRITAS